MKIIKIAVVAVVVIIAAIMAMVVYRMFFLFNAKKVKAYITDAANQTGAPNAAYKIINEVVESIKKSQDLTSAVVVSAQISGVEKEQALVMAALNQCYAMEWIERPKPAETEKESKQPSNAE